MFKHKKFLNVLLVLKLFVQINGKEDIPSEIDSTLLQIMQDQVTQMQTTIGQLISGSNFKDFRNSNRTMFDIRIESLPENCLLLDTPSNCAEATVCTKRSGYYFIKLDRFSNESFLVECDAETEGGSWIVIQRRQDGSVDFYRSWADYQAGFGDIDGELFIGLDKLHALTNYDGRQELLITMENTSADGKGVTSASAKYDSFAIGDKCDKYILKRIGKYSGNAGDSLQEHIGCKFTTKDQDNDNHANNCADMYMGGWWYNWCHRSNLNGHYRDATVGKGINWFTWHGDTVSLKYVKMMIRRH